MQSSPHHHHHQIQSTQLSETERQNRSSGSNWTSFLATFIMLQQSIHRLAARLRHQAIALFEPFGHRFPLRPQLQPLGVMPSGANSCETSSSPLDIFSEAFWFAVPKKKVSRSRKRKKTTNQFRIKKKKNIITCPRTGELTLQHKLPFNWKQYNTEFVDGEIRSRFEEFNRGTPKY